MRQKDFVEVAAVLGDEVRLCDGQELEGLLAAFNALVGHARFRYPEVDAGVVVDRFCSAVEHGWGDPAEACAGVRVTGQMSAMICDEDGWVRSGAWHWGTDYKCTGSVHPPEDSPIWPGHEVWCANPIHDVKLPLANTGTVALADIAGPTAPGPGEIMQAIGAAGAATYARDAWSMVRRIATQPQMPAFDPFGSCWTCGAPRVAEVRAQGHMVLVCSVDGDHNPDGYQPRVEVSPRS